MFFKEAVKIFLEWHFVAISLLKKSEDVGIAAHALEQVT